METIPHPVRNEADQDDEEDGENSKRSPDRDANNNFKRETDT